MQDLQDPLGLCSLHLAYEWPEEMQPQLHADWRRDTPTPIRLPFPLPGPDPGNCAEATEGVDPVTNDMVIAIDLGVSVRSAA